MQQGVKILSFYYDGRTELCLCPNGRYETVLYERRMEKHGEYDRDYLISIMRDNKIPVYPPTRVEVNSILYQVGDYIQSVHPNTMQIAEQITHFGYWILNNTYTLIAHTNSYPNGIDITQIIHKAPEPVEELENIFIHGSDYHIHDYTMYNDEKLKIIAIHKTAGVVLVLLENPSYPGAQVEILAENLGKLIENPLAPDPPRSFEINPILVTEDGANAFDGDTIFHVKDNKISSLEINQGITLIPEGLFFSSKEIAEEHLTRTSRLFSYQDIIDLELTKSSVKLDSLMELAKQRMYEERQIN